MRAGVAGNEGVDNVIRTEGGARTVPLKGGQTGTRPLVCIRYVGHGGAWG